MIQFKEISHDPLIESKIIDGIFIYCSLRTTTIIFKFFEYQIFRGQCRLMGNSFEEFNEIESL